ncbi:uncharacterized protein LOC135831297 [Planococcus citri]|uniref:uncharacterized protein LOC135831297 n=1 Tax=Planococcus citri TaxID=170843 RepID=UPI0031F7279F
MSRWSKNQHSPDQCYLYYKHSVSKPPEPSPGPINVAGEYSKCHDVSVKVGEAIYPMNRLQLALVSNYFEKLFVEGFVEKDRELVEIHAFDSNTFSAIIDVINGKDLKSLINANTYVSLLIAMDYLEMEINLEPFEEFMKTYTKQDMPFDTQMLELYRLIATNRDFKDLNFYLYYYLSCHFTDFVNYPEFLILPLDDLIDIIKIQQDVSRLSCSDEMNIICQVCVKWILHDVEKRLNNFVKLANAANYRLHRSSLQINTDCVNARLNNMKGDRKEEQIRRYFHQLLNYSGEIHPNDSEDPGISKETILPYRKVCHKLNGRDVKEKLAKMLENGYLCDATIEAGVKTYKLHQCVLKTASGYFADLFSAKSCEPLSIHEDKGKKHVINIDENTFDAIVKFMYFDDISLNAFEQSMKILRAGKILKINTLIEKSLSWMESNAKDLSIEDILQILDFALGDYSLDGEDCNRISKLACKILLFKTTKNLTYDIIRRIWKVNKILKSDALTSSCVLWMGNNFQTSYIKDIVEILYEVQEKEKLSWFLNNLGVRLPDNIFQVLYASENMQFEKLTNRCMKRFMENESVLTEETITKLLDFTRGKEKFDHEHGILLCKRMVATWPNVDESQFCTISCNVLENLLTLPNFFSKNPYKILDVCAKWIVHDVKNRYRLIPRIAFSINRNCTMDPDDYKMTETPQNLDNCSQLTIKNKLWETLSLTSLVPRCNNTTDLVLKESPLFIYSYTGLDVKEFRCDVLDTELNVITSLKSLRFHYECTLGPKCPISATLIKDNLFVLCKNYYKSDFFVYNLSSKKFYTLSGIPRIHSPGKSTLLNCNNQVYCCSSEENDIMRYYVELNRWEVISNAEIKVARDSDFKKITLFTSDGTNLYRVFNIPIKGSRFACKYVVQTWNFNQGRWIMLPDLPNLPDSRQFDAKLTNIKNGIAILVQCMVFLFDLQSQSWRHIALPLRAENGFDRYVSFITHYDDGLLYACNDKLFQLRDMQGEWVLIKQSQFKFGNAGCDADMSLIHRSSNETCTTVGLTEKKKNKEKERVKKKRTRSELNSIWKKSRLLS